MIYCINHLCTQRCNPDNAKNCLACGNSLLINGRIRLLRPLRSLEENLYTNTNVFEVEDVGTKSHPESQIRVMKVLKWSEPKLVELVQREARILQIIQYPGIPESARDDYFTLKLKDTLLELHCLVIDLSENGKCIRQMDFSDYNGMCDR